MRVAITGSGRAGPTARNGGHIRRGLVCSTGLLAVAALLTTLAPAGAAQPAPARPATARAAVDPNQPTLIWGGTARPRNGQDNQQAQQALDAQVGRSLAAVRFYLLWDTPFPDSYHQWAADSGRLPLISVNSKRTNGTPVLWKDIANAQPGSALYNQIVGWATKIKNYAVPVYFTFNHEPEAAASDAFGTDAEFIAAWRKVITTFRQQGVTNAKYLWIMTGWSFVVGPADHRQAIKWFPGDAYIDALGSDEYNDFTCRTDSDAPWKSLASEIEPFRQFGLQHPDKEMWMPEYGSFEDAAVPGRKAQWINDVRTAFKSDLYSQFRGILYFHSFRPGTPCLWWVDSSASSLAAWKAMGQDVFYTKRYGDEPPPPPPPPPGDKALLVVGTTTLGVGDAAVKARLEADGYDVSVIDDDVAGAADTTGEDVVVVSSTSDDRLLKAKLRDVAAPVLIWKATLYDDMGMTAPGANGIERSTSVSIVNAAHPLAAGQSGTVAILTSADSMPWGTVGASADVVATVAGKATLFAYTRGDALPGGGTAAGCRIGFPAYHTSPARFTAAGKALFDAAVAWADACPH